MMTKWRAGGEEGEQKQKQQQEEEDDDDDGEKGLDHPRQPVKVATRAAASSDLARLDLLRP